jgi:hypothetical protein
VSPEKIRLERAIWLRTQSTRKEKERKRKSFQEKEQHNRTACMEKLQKTSQNMNVRNSALMQVSMFKDQSRYNNCLGYTTLA